MMMIKSRRDWVIAKACELARDPRGSCAVPPSLYRSSSHIREPRGVCGMVGWIRISREALRRGLNRH